jgi:hypothetical protein
MDFDPERTVAGEADDRHGGCCARPERSCCRRAPNIMSLHLQRPCYVVDKRSLPRSALPVCNRAPVLAVAVPQPYWQTDGLG